MRKSILSCLMVAVMLLLGSVQASALNKDSEGVYQISTVTELLDFADLVNFGTETNAKAVLLNDLDLYGEEYYPIGNVEHPYIGTFDGKGHIIKNLNIDSETIGIEEYLGFFGVVSGGATIRNIIIGGGDDAFIGGSRFCAGVVGGTNGKGNVLIENCGNEAWIYTTEENAAGILGVDMLSEADVTILNCYNTGEIKGGRECAALCGWIGDHGVMKNCWNTGDVTSGADTGRPFCRFNGCEFENNWDTQCVQENIGKILESDLKGIVTGEFCYRVLNQTAIENVAWYQKLGTDEHPYPFADHGTVYAVGDLNCDGTAKSGETTYSNTNTSTRDPHQFDHGACAKCDEFDPDYLKPDADNYYTLASDADLYWFVRLCNMKGKNDANARLTADITYTHQARLGDELNYMGVFDGQNHTVKFEFSSDADKLAFIKNMEDATVKNLLLKGDIYSTTHFSAGVVSEAYGKSVIKNVVSEVNITSMYEGDATHGGLVAVGHQSLQIENCAYNGKLYAPYAVGTGGIMGWSGDGSQASIKHCYVGGELVLKAGSENVVIARNNPYIEDCWVSSINEEKYGENVYTTYYDAAGTETGELCYKWLNATAVENVYWYQTLGKDLYPVPFADHGIVYVAGAQYCDGTPKGEATGYSNNPAGDRDPHVFADGFCTHCGGVDMNYKKPGEDGFIAIGSDDDLYWFALYSKTQDTKNANAKLTADINYTHDEMIGMARCSYGGVFDGQEHTITVDINRDEAGRAAIFDDVEGATIKNLVVDGSIYCAGQFAGGLAVEARDNTLIKNVVVKANIFSDYDGDGTHGGIVAIGYGNLVIENCAFVGTLEADLSSGSCGIIGYTHGGNNTSIKNTYVGGELYLLEGSNNNVICRNNPYLDNCWASWDCSYYEMSDAVQLFNVDGEMTSGELCYNLHGEGNGWFQNLGTDNYPVPFASHDVVYAHGNLDCAGVGDITYNNTPGTPERAAHSYIDGVCQHCHNAYLISNGFQLTQFSTNVMEGTATHAYAELDGDISLTGADFFPIGGRADEGSNPFCGEFDGKGHKISNMVIDAVANNQGLFGAVGDGAHIKNVIVDNTCSVTITGDDTKGYAAAIVGATVGAGKVTIENCGSEADITVPGPNAAGILGVDDLGQMVVTIKNCYNTGKISGNRESAGIAGWLGARSVIVNSWNSGAVEGLDGENTFFRNGAAKASNCYETIGHQVTAVTDEQVGNGQLKDMLNAGAKAEYWYQNVGTDNHPMLDFEYIVQGIEEIPAVVAGKAAEGIFTIGGAKVSQMQKGVNIVRMVDGTVRKVLVK